MSDLSPQPRIAVLVDGDNARPDHLSEVIQLVKKYGRITIKRVYGDWTMPQMSSWKAVVQRDGAHPMQQFRNSTGKNATDGAMIIDAMDILHANLVEAFAIVSSDGDFTRLVTRIRENGLSVIGLGEKARAANAFVLACDLFVDLNAAGQEAANTVKPLGPKREVPVTVSKAAGLSKAPTATPALTAEQMVELRELFLGAFEKCTRPDGWATIGSFGLALRKVRQDFKPQLYGSAQLRKLFDRCPKLIEFRKATNGLPTQIDVRLVKPK